MTGVGKIRPTLPVAHCSVGILQWLAVAVGVELAAGDARGRHLDHGAAEMAVDHEAGRAERHDLGRPAAWHVPELARLAVFDHGDAVGAHLGEVDAAVMPHQPLRIGARGDHRGLGRRGLRKQEQASASQRGLMRSGPRR